MWSKYLNLKPTPTTTKNYNTFTSYNINTSPKLFSPGKEEIPTLRTVSANIISLSWRRLKEEISTSTSLAMEKWDKDSLKLYSNKL